MRDRREFLKTVGTASLAVAGLSSVPGCARGERPNEAQRSSDGGSGQLDDIGVQLYTVRSMMDEGAGQVFERVAAIGYREVEFPSLFGIAPPALRELLDASGLRAPAAHVPLRGLEEDPEAFIDMAEILGLQHLIVAWLVEADRDSVATLRRTAERFNRVGENLRSAGLTFGYHNHAFEFEPVEGQLPYDVLLAESDPKLVKFEMDFYWIRRGGADPLAYFEQYPGRFPCVHVKDMALSGEMADVGQGEIDFAELFRHREQAGIEHFFVEHDNPPDPFASITNSYNYLRELTF